MARPSLADVLAACLDDIRSGRSIDDCLAAYPELRDELEPLLRLAQRLAPPPVALDPARKRQARHQFVEALHREARAPRPWWQSLALPPWAGAGRRALPVALALFVTLSVAGGGVASAAQEAQPGDALYGVKTTIEQLQVALVSGESGKAEAQLRIAERRFAEMLAALDRHDEQAVTTAARGYEVALEQTYKHLEKARERGVDGDVEAVQGRLTDQEEQHQQALSRARERAAAPAQEALTRVQERQQARAAERQQDKAQKDQGDALTAPPSADGGQSGGKPAKDDQTQRPADAPSPSPDPQPTALSTAISTLQEATRALETRKADDQASSETVGGLQAKLRAAEAAIARGQWSTAANQLAAFGNELEALSRSGRIDSTSYETLKNAHKELADLVAARAPSQAEQRGSEKTGGPDAGPSTTVTATVTITVTVDETPTPPPGKADPPGKGNSKPEQPPGAGGRAKE